MRAGSQEGYFYSPALRQAQIVWDRDSLDEWLDAPMQMVPGTRMILGEPDPVKRKAIIDYLETLQPEHRPSD